MKNNFRCHHLALVLLPFAVSLAGCGHGDQNSSTPPPPPAVPVQQQIQQIQNDPNLPAQVKAIRIQHARDTAGPAATQQATPPTH